MLVFLLFAPVSCKFYRLWCIGPLAIYAVRSGRVGRFALYTALLTVFDDFSFTPESPRTFVYAMAVLAVCILYMEVRYVLDLLYSKPVRDRVPAST